MANWIDDLLGKDIADNGSVVSPRRGVLNFIDGFGITVSAVDNPTTGYTDVTIATTGSSTGGVDYKDSVRVATTANITLSGLQTIDGVALSTNERVLVWKQSTQAENGIYAAAAGAWTRTTDANTDQLVTTGMMVPASEGTLYAGKTFKLITADPIIVDTTGLTFELQPQTLSEILAKGNTSGANNILVDDSQYIQIGTTSPAGSGALRLRGNGDGAIRWRNVGDTGDYGIEATGGDSILIGGGSAQPFATYINGTGSVFIQNNVDTLVEFTPFFGANPAIYLNSEFAGGTATLALISTTVPASSMNGIDLIIVGGNAGPGNNNAGNLKLLPGVPTGSGAPASVVIANSAVSSLAEFIDDATPRFELYVPNILFDIAVSAPKIWQEDQTANSTNGQKLSVIAQNATGTTSTGGDWDAGPGSGTTAGGLGRLISGSGAQRVGFDDTGLGFFTATPVAQPADQVAFTDNISGTPSRTLAAIPDPSDTPADADALRDDIVANVLPKIRDALSSLADGYNDVRANVLQPLGLTA